MREVKEEWPDRKAMVTQKTTPNNCGELKSIFEADGLRLYWVLYLELDFRLQRAQFHRNVIVEDWKNP